MSIYDQTIETLEFPKIRERLAAHTSFSASRSLALALLPTTDEAEVVRRLQLTSEARVFLNQHADATIGSARDIREHVQHAARGGRLDPLELTHVAHTLASMRRLRGLLQVLDEREFPLLCRFADDLPEYPAIESEIERAIGHDGTVLDSASPLLARLRSEIHSMAQRLQEKLQRIIGSSGYGDILQEQLVTVRNGRYVVPVKAAHRRTVEGLVHDHSSSGATVYIEPMAVVELNNQLRGLEQDEAQEVERILTMLSQRVGGVAGPVGEGVTTLATLDLFFAQAKYADGLRCIEPTIVGPSDLPPSEPLLSLIQARHPLLNQETVIPIDVWLGGDFRLLLITGPNTGGKTVALKTVGLLTLMAQAGLHIPVGDQSQLPVFEGVFSDIGDEQSIEQSLSTFSSHMSTIIRMLNAIEETLEASGGATSHTTAANGEMLPPPTLVLLDEIGAGTDPIEGSALAQAIIERFLARGCLGIITTHYAELKAFAHNTDGVENGSTEFNSETLAPTYKLTIGLPGHSNALAIASRLGLDTALVDRAQGMMSRDALHIEALLEDIRAKHEAAAEKAQRAEQLRDDAEKYRQRLQEERDEFERTRQQRLDVAVREVEEEVREARAELQQLRQSAKDGGVSRKRARDMDRDLHAIKTRVQQAGRPTGQSWQSTTSQRPSQQPLEVGDTVLVRSIGQTGEIVELDPDEKTAEVQIGGFRVSVKVKELLLEKKGQSEHQQRGSSRSVAVPDAPNVSMNLDMRGWRVADVDLQLDQYLNDAYLSSLPFVHLIHGKGTGALRQAVHDLLRRHPLIKSFKVGQENGDTGMTVARLVER
jgi:DNA mismatch repair protein MutS2